MKQDKRSHLMFSSENYRLFSLYLGHLKKCVDIIEARFGEKFSIKGVHPFWIYELSRYPGGLTATELSKLCDVNRSLVSREMPVLLEQGIVFIREENAGKKYNRRFLLTEKGQTLAKEVSATAEEMQQKADRGISAEEMVIFRKVLKTMSINFENMISEA